MNRSEVVYRYGPIFFLLVGAFLLRFLWLDHVPARLTSDEMSIGYNAYSLAQTGRDEWGQPWPLTFRAFGDYKLPGYIYSVVPLVAVFGLNLYALKLPSILAGVASVFLVYRLGQQLFDNRKLALLAGGVMATTPWAIHLSRQALESNLALALFLLGLTVLLTGLSNKRFWWLFAGSALIGLTAYVYVAYRMIGFITVGGLLILLWRRGRDMRVVAGGLIGFFLVLLPLLPSLFSRAGTARLEQVSVFSDPGVASAVEENRSMCLLTYEPLFPVCRVIFNPIQETGLRITRHYSQFLSPSFLFIEGDAIAYLSNPQVGELLLVLWPFYLVGLVHWFRETSDSNRLVQLTFLVAPVPAALVGEPQVVRGSLVLPLVVMVTSLGVWRVFAGLTKPAMRHLAALLLSGGYLVFFGYYLATYFLVYPAKLDAAADPLPLEVAEYIQTHGQTYDTVYISDEFADAHIYLAYYLALDPAWYQEEIVWPDPDEFGFTHASQLGTYHFGSSTVSQLPCDEFGDVLYVGGPNSENGAVIAEFSNFSGVHVQATLLERTCP